jgi:hypothetical protein
VKEFSLADIETVSLLVRPHAFQIREMGNEVENGMDRWLWDLLDSNIDDAMF